MSETPEQTNLEAEMADKRPPWPAPLPKWFWPWAKWRDKGGIPKERPHGTPTRIPAWAWDRYKLHRGATPPPASSAFGGTGLFTAWDPGVILRQKPKVDWVAVTTDVFNGVPGCSAVMAQQLRIAGYRVHVWESRMEHGVGVCYRLRAEGYIGQAESEVELRKCLGLASISGRPKAVVGNVTAWSEASKAQARADGWELILEHYRNEQPGLQPDSRGYPVASFCFGLYPGAAGRVYLADYLAELAGVSWSGYLAEELSDEDWKLIGRKP